ncbi:MAG: S1/P1 nuclease [Flavobacteriaceae bacterium]|nr:S1/P1 nuclease [Flavobacteriaceae bacterium]
MKKIILLVAVAIFSVNASYSNKPFWGKTGHRTVGEIASKYLDEDTAKAIADLLDGESLASASTYGDDIKSDKNYNKFYQWHYVNFPFDTKYSDSEKAKKGDLIMGIETCIRIIKDKKNTRENRVLYLKMLIHFIGDLHQPLHVGRGEDKGGNDIKVTWFYKKSNIHRVWDSDMIDRYKMSYTELANNVKRLSDSEAKAIQSGSLMDWVIESQNLSKKVYASVKMGDKLSYKYAYKHFGTVKEQLQKGGLRLAKILNEIMK